MVAHKEHIHHGKSSASFLDSDEILAELNLNGNEVFMDAGCGDGHIALKALSEYLPDGTVYAVDNFDMAIEELDEYKKENNIKNLVNIKGDFTKSIEDVEDGKIDVVLMLNIFHGFGDIETRDNVVNELSRLIGGKGRIAIMDFNPIDLSFGPPKEIKIAPGELEEIFARHNFKKIHLNENMGPESSQGNSHYMIIFEKE